MREPCRKRVKRSSSLPASLDKDAETLTRNLLEMLQHGGATFTERNATVKSHTPSESMNSRLWERHANGSNGHTPSESESSALQQRQMNGSSRSPSESTSSTLRQHSTNGSNDDHDHTYSIRQDLTGKVGDKYYNRNVTSNVNSPEKTGEITVFASELDWNMWKFEQKLFESIRKFPVYYLTNECIRTLALHHFNTPYTDIQLPDDFYPTDSWISQYRRKYQCVTSSVFGDAVLDNIRVDLRVPVFTQREMKAYLREEEGKFQDRCSDSGESLFQEVVVTNKSKKRKKRRSRKERDACYKKQKTGNNGCITTYPDDPSRRSPPEDDEVSVISSKTWQKSNNGCYTDDPSPTSPPEDDEVNVISSKTWQEINNGCYTDDPSPTSPPEDDEANVIPSNFWQEKTNGCCPDDPSRKSPPENDEASMIPSNFWQESTYGCWTDDPGRRSPLEDKEVTVMPSNTWEASTDGYCTDDLSLTSALADDGVNVMPSKWQASSNGFWTDDLSRTLPQGVDEVTMLLLNNPSMILLFDPDFMKHLTAFVEHLLNDPDESELAIVW